MRKVLFAILLTLVSISAAVGQNGVDPLDRYITFQMDPVTGGVISVTTGGQVFRRQNK